MASMMISGFSRGKRLFPRWGISEGNWNHQVIRFWISTQEKRRQMSRELSCRARDLSSSGYPPFYLALHRSSFISLRAGVMLIQHENFISSLINGV
jgi:hypothetical protein